MNDGDYVPLREFQELSHEATKCVHERNRLRAALQAIIDWQDGENDDDLPALLDNARRAIRP